MDGEVTAALTSGASGLVGALPGGAVAVWTGMHQGELTAQSALETARSTYLGPLDTARRSVQRDVFVAFLTVSREWARSAERAAYAAQQWDARVGDVLEMCITQERLYGGVGDIALHWQGMIRECRAPHRVTEAAQHVLLEAATTDVARAAQDVEQHAIRLSSLMREAGETELRDIDDVSPQDPSNHVPPSPNARRTSLRP
jgi:hypothetical protein